MKLVQFILLLLLGMTASAWAQTAAFVHTQPAGPITTTNATLNGMVVPNGLPTTAWFEWGSWNYFSETTTPVLLNSNAPITRVTASITGLTNGSLHRCRLVASNSAGTIYGVEQLFTTGRRAITWGYSPSGQLNVPATLTNAVGLGAGYTHLLAVRNDGSVFGWGTNGYGKATAPAGLSNVVAVTGGYDHSLALKANGTVVVWGDNAYGQTNMPVNLSNVVAVAAGGSHNLALKSDGTVVAWGWNGQGQTNVPAGLSNVVSVSAGNRHSVALKADGKVETWGDPSWGQRNVPYGLEDVIILTAGGYHNVAVRSNDMLVTWGHNSYGQTNPTVYWTSTIAVVGGFSHSLALTSGGGVYAWGSGSTSTGIYPEYGQSAVPLNLRNAVAVAAGENHSAALANRHPSIQTLTLSGYQNRDIAFNLVGHDPDGDELTCSIITLPMAGTLYQYDNGARGPAITTINTLVTDGSRRVIFAPAPGGGGSPYATFGYQLSDGELPVSALVTIHIRALEAATLDAVPIRTTTATLNGMVVANNEPTTAWFEWSELGGSFQTTPPVDIGTNTVAVHVTQPISGLTNGRVYQCRLVASNAFVLKTGAVKRFTPGRKLISWGGNLASLTNFPAATTNVVQVSGGYNFSTALTADGTAFAWGATNAPTNVPAGLSNVVALAAGTEHVLALRENRTVAAWGRGSATNVPLNLSNVIAVAAGGGTDNGTGFSLALKADGRVVAWGVNTSGQTNVPFSTTNVVAIAAGQSHSVALRSDGRVTVWGSNLSGQTNVPASATNVVAIAARATHNLALKADGRLVAWGGSFNGSGSTPASLSNVIAIAMGEAHGLALKADGTLAAWGNNTYGQTNVPAGMTNLASIAGGYRHDLALGNVSPTANSLTVTGAVNQDWVVTLRGSDLNADALGFRISTLPVVGSLHQFTDLGRGAAITAPDTSLSDPLGRVIFAPATDASGWPHATFTFIANDGEADSSPATLTVNIIPAPVIEVSSLSVGSNGGFSLSFSADTNATYRVWASTNLTTWSVLGSAIQSPPGVFNFTDAAATNWPLRFYLVTCP